MVTSPIHSTPSMPGTFEEDSVLTTPHAEERRPVPEHGEMHPSKVHHSTAKVPDSGLRLGVADIKEHEKSEQQGLTSSPSKPKRPPSSAGFEFKWNRPESDLSNEAQRIMESVREEAARIKVQMQTEREEQARKDEEADGLGKITQRRFAKPKGRFSDAHRDAFKKMDSIANHASTWKKKYASNAVPGQAGIKRSQSKANLSDTRKDEGSSDRVENTSPGKRMKASAADDVSKARAAVEQNAGEKTPTRQSDLPSVVTTPTQSSLAHATSVKSTKTITKIPSLMQSKSVKDLRSPSNKTSDSFGPTSPLRKAMSMKSILVKPHVKYSDDPLKIAAGTHLPFPKDRATPVVATPEPMPASPSKLPTTATPKRVNFSASTNDSDHVTDDGTADPLPPPSPSPTKIPSLPAQLFPPPALVSPSKTPTKPVTYPTLHHPPTPMPHPLASNPPTPPVHAMAPQAPPQRAAFDFTAPSSALLRPQLTQPPPSPPRPQMPMGPPPSRIRLPTIRHVRPSGVPTPMEDQGFSGRLAGVPHGMANKKRRRADDDEDEAELERNKGNAKSGEKENVRPSSSGGVGQSEGSPTKKARMMEEVKETVKAVPERRRLFKSKSSSAVGGAPKERRGLSLARLNMLARPKDRR